MPNISAPSAVVSASATALVTSVLVPRSNLPLELNAEVTTASGARFRWGANEAADSRFKNFSFSTKIGEGFSDASVQLSRPFLIDTPDTNLIDTITFTGADGAVAYEGRNSAMPRELGDGSTIGVTMAGWMAHASDRKFKQNYVDRDLSAWQDMPVRRRAFLLTNANTPTPITQGNDPGNTAKATVSTNFTGAWTTYTPTSEAWYDAGSLRVARVVADWQRGGSTGTNADANWQWAMYLSDNDMLNGGLDTTNNLAFAGPSLGQNVATISPTRRYAVLFFKYAAAPAGADGAAFTLDWSNIAVYGMHGIPIHVGDPTQPPGVYAGDVIRDIVGKYCEELNPAGVTSSNYVIQHLAFKDAITPFDAMQQVNKYHLFNLAVWEDKTLYWQPFDLTKYDWQVRTDDANTTFQLQGPSVASVFNGITVSFTDLLNGTPGYISPDTNPELADTDPTNPWNQHGIKRWDDLELSYPSTIVDAGQSGRAALADRNRSKHPGQITVQGYIRDAAGNEQPGWRPRAGQTVAITDHAFDAPRLIHETTWDDDTKTLTLTVDGPPSILDAQVDRVLNSLTAQGLS